MDNTLKIRSDNTSGYPGVHFDKRHNLWVASLEIKGTRKIHKYFKTKEDAITARMRLMEEYSQEIKQAHTEKCHKQKVYKTEEDRRAATLNIQKRCRQKLNKEQPLLMFFRDKKSGAEQLGIAFEIEFSDLTMPQCCAICSRKIFLTRSVGYRKARQDDAATLDRINPNKHYFNGNWKWVCWQCNRLKSDCIESSRFRAIANYIDSNFSS